MILKTFIDGGGSLTFPSYCCTMEMGTSTSVWNTCDNIGVCNVAVHIKLRRNGSISIIYILYIYCPIFTVCSHTGYSYIQWQKYGKCYIYMYIYIYNTCHISHISTSLLYIINCNCKLSYFHSMQSYRVPIYTVAEIWQVLYIYIYIYMRQIALDFHAS